MIPVASEIGIDTPENMVKNAFEVLDLGIKIIKIKGSSNHMMDVERIKAVRKAVGNDIELRLDPNAAWDVNSTIKTMKLLEEYNLPG